MIPVIVHMCSQIFAPHAFASRPKNFVVISGVRAGRQEKMIFASSRGDSGQPSSSHFPRMATKPVLKNVK